MQNEQTTENLALALLQVLIDRGTRPGKGMPIQSARLQLGIIRPAGEFEAAVQFAEGQGWIALDPERLWISLAPEGGALIPRPGARILALELLQVLAVASTHPGDGMLIRAAYHQFGTHRPRDDFWAALLYASEHDWVTVDESRGWVALTEGGLKVV